MMIDVRDYYSSTSSTLMDLERALRALDRLNNVQEDYQLVTTQAINVEVSTHGMRNLLRENIANTLMALANDAENDLKKINELIVHIEKEYGL